MDQLTRAKVVVLYCAGAFLLSLCLVPVYTSKLEDQSTNTIKHVDDTLTKVDGTIDKLNQDMDHANEMVGTLNQTATNIAHATDKWNKATDQQLEAVNHIADDFRATTVKLNRAIGDVRDLVDTTKSQLVYVAPLLDSTRKLSDQATVSVAHLDQRITDPRIDQFMLHLEGTSSHIDHTTGLIDAKLDRLINPPPCKGKWCWLIHTYGAIKIAGDLAEPTYFGIEAGKALTGK